jgi:hypothetical protein
MEEVTSEHGVNQELRGCLVPGTRPCLIDHMHSRAHGSGSHGRAAGRATPQSRHFCKGIYVPLRTGRKSSHFVMLETGAVVGVVDQPVLSQPQLSQAVHAMQFAACA